MRKVLVTGANGFIGREAVRQLHQDNWSMVRAMRSVDGEDACAIGDIGPVTSWRNALCGVTHVLHLAAHVHDPSGAEATFQRVNVEGSVHLAREAARAGVSRFVYVSSVKAQCDMTHDVPLHEGDPFAPGDAYGRSKRDAELALRDVAVSKNLDLVIVRPPLVYGRAGAGNLARLMWLLSLGLPLPLASVNNRRSLVSVENLVSLLLLCLKHPGAANEVFLAADEPALSTPELLRLMARGLGVPSRLFTAPPAILRFAANCIGRQSEANRLFQSLEMDATKARTRLDWKPLKALDDGIIEMAQDYAAHRRG